MNKSNVVDYLYVIARRRKLIVVNFMLVSVATAIISLVIPKTFTSKTTILPPSGEGAGLGLSSLIDNFAIGKLGLGGLSDNSFTFIAILNSRTIMEAIAEKFNLIDQYRTENMEDTVEALRQNVSVEVNEDGTITLAASAKTGFLSNEGEEDETRKRARDIANAFIEELDRVNNSLKTEKAHNNRIFIEKRYEQNLSDLKEAEEALKHFQETYGVIAMPEQTEAAIATAAELKAQITVKEIEVAVLNQYVSPSHGELSRARNELRELRKKLEEMKTGTSGNPTNGGQGDVRLFIPLDETPDIGLRYLRLYREVTIQQTLLEFLLPQYEQAKIQEAKDSPTVQVLDKAVSPVLRSKPKRSIMVIIAAMLSVAFSVTIAFSLEYVRNLETTNQEDHRKLEEIFHSIRADLRKFIPWKSRD